jgi:hypothetical protein
MTAFQDTLHTFRQAYSDLLNALATSPTDKRTQDNLAQLCGWLQEALRRYPRYEGGTTNIHYNEEGFNAVSVRLRQHKTWQEIISEVQHLADQLANTAQALPPHLIQKDPRYADWLVSLTRDCLTQTAHLRQIYKNSVK